MAEVDPVSWTPPNSWGVEPRSGIPDAEPKPPYPPELRAEAVRLARALGNSIRRVARDLGVSNESLRRWVIQADTDHGDSPGLTSDERAELTRLRRDIRTLRMEREVLKKPRSSSPRRPTRPGDRVPVHRARED
jgi:transposase